MANEIERSHLDCFKVWRYRGHLLFPRCLSSRYLCFRPHGCLVASRRLVFGAGRVKYLPNLGCRKSYPERSPKACSFTLSGWPGQPGVSVCQSIHPWHECMQTSTLSPVQNGMTMVRNLHHPILPVASWSQPPLSRQNVWKSSGTSQAGMKSSAGSVVESTQRFDTSVPSFRIFY